MRHVFKGSSAASKILIVAMILGFTAASSTQLMASASSFVKADTTNPYGGANIDPLPANATIFSVVNGKKTINYSKNDLLAIKSSIITIYEPFVKKNQSFTVIPLDYFLGKSSISASKSIDTIALNDYIYTNKAGNFSKAKAFIAFKRFGKDIPYNQGGPLRLIYSNSSSWAKNLDAWNWSLKTIKVRTTD
jgi:hypothetical protein